jgi:hypothetical protein
MTLVKRIGDWDIEHQTYYQTKQAGLQAIVLDCRRREQYTVSKNPSILVLAIKHHH